MATPTLQQITQSLANLLPSGQAWQKIPTAKLWLWLSFIAPSFWRLYGYADFTKQDAFPLTTTVSLPTWQQSVGLPDPNCPPLSLPQQRTQMLSRVTTLGGQSIPFIVAYAAQFGYQIKITNHGVPRAGQAKAGIARSWNLGTYGDNVFQITVLNSASYPFVVGQRVGQPLATYTPNIAWLVFELKRILPCSKLVFYL